MTPDTPAAGIVETGAGETPDAVLLALELGAALHRLGTPSHRLEETLEAVCARLGESGQFFATPTAIFASFGPPARQRTALLRTLSGEVDLGRLADLDAIVGRILHGDLDPAGARAAIAAVLDAPPRFGRVATVAGFALASTAAARFFDGGWAEATTAACVGVALGTLASISERRPALARVLVPLAAFLAATGVVAASAAPWRLSAFVATLAGLIVFLPGLTLTTAVSELASRHLSSGTARLTGAGMTLLELAFGVAVGTKLGLLVPGASATIAPVPPPGWTEGVALAAAPLGFAVLFRARPRDLPAVYLAALTAYVAARFGSAAYGPELGAFGGALAVGLVGNLYRRVLDRPATVAIVPGIMFLVPGSLGYRSVSALLAQDVVTGVGTAFTMAITAVSLVAGLLLANVVLPTRKTL